MKKFSRNAITLGLATGMFVPMACALEDGNGSPDAAHDGQEHGTGGHIADGEAPLLADVEEVQGFEVYGTADEAHEVSVRVGEHYLRFALEPNYELLASDFQVIRDGKSYTFEEAGLRMPLRGRVEGDSDSWARLAAVGDGYEGLFWRDGDLWEIRGPQEGRRSGYRGWVVGRANVEDYLEDSHGGAHQCGTTATYRLAQPVSTAAVAASTCKTIDIALVGDYTHVAKLGSATASENERLARLNETDGLYRTDINRGFVLKEMMTFASEGGPSFNVAGVSNTPLDQFTAWKKANLPQRGLAHLFVGKTSSGTVGLAWVGATCHATYGAGVSNYLGTSRSSTIVFAHEVGHNFGSSHDPSGAAYIMAPSVNRTATTFSATSKTAITNHLASVSCFVDCTADDTSTGTTSTSTSTTSTSTSTTSTSTSTSSTTSSTTTSTTTTTTTGSTQVTIPGVKLYSVSSEEVSAESGAAVNAIDGKGSTIWHSRWSTSAAPAPHSIIFDLGANYNVSGLQYLPRQDASTSGHIASFRIYVWVGSGWVGAAQGTFGTNKTRKTVTFAPVSARYIGLIADTSSGGDNTASAAEISILQRL